jgi:hypothetical protein
MSVVFTHNCIARADMNNSFMAIICAARISASANFGHW